MGSCAVVFLDLPIAMMAHANRVPVIAIASVRPALTLAATGRNDSISTPQYVGSVALTPHWPTRPELNQTLAVAWGLASCGLLMVWGAAAFRYIPKGVPSMFLSPPTCFRTLE